MTLLVPSTSDLSAYGAGFAKALPALFGGEPGWLTRRVPGGTEFDFVNGRAIGPGFSFSRVPGTTKWALAS